LILTGERVVQTGQVHGIVYSVAVTAALLTVALVIGAMAGSDSRGPDWILLLAAILFFFIALVAFLNAAIRRNTTEIAVTNRRFVVKRGLLRRSVMEIGVGQIESVSIYQSFFGRLFGYGTIVVAGTGSSIDPVQSVSNPLSLRQALAACTDIRSCRAGGAPHDGEYHPRQEPCVGRIVLQA
jgi:uncharacterized membrane protein YdbT with pleckstrin-like domain